jgi:hypothetical protein
VLILPHRQAEFLKIRNQGVPDSGRQHAAVLPDHRPAGDATHSILINIAGVGSALTTQVVRAE